MTDLKNGGNRYIETAYKSIVYLALMYHILFACLIAGMNYVHIFIYYLAVCAFYASMLWLVNKGIYGFTTVAVHVEIVSFMIVNTVLFGWNAGFHAYLLALASLVYFNPFKNKRVMYMFSFVEAVLFFALKIYTMRHAPMLDIGAKRTDMFFLINYAGCFVVVVCGAAVFKVSADTTEMRLQKKTQSLQNKADHDTLTQLYTRSYLIKQFQSVQESGVPFSAAMCDIDNFKKINDTYGHNCGDYILKSIAAIIRDNSPQNAIVTRWGGEEFIVLLEDYDITKSRPLIEEIRERVAGTEFVYKEWNLHVTMTFGIATSMERTDLTGLIELADDRMYTGKQSGKNRVVDDSYGI